MTHTLEAGTGGSGFRASITTRVAAHDALTRFFRIQDRTPARSALGRVFGRDVLSSASRPLFAAVQAELAIAESLTRLDDDWVVLHSVPVAGRDSSIDHLVIGPGGIFALTVVIHSDQSVRVAHGAFEAAGSRHNHIRNSEFEVGCVERLLGAALGSPVTATGVIVIVNPRSVTISENPRDVAIVASRELVSWLQNQPPSLTVADVDRLVWAASKPCTWLTDSFPDDGVDDALERFFDIATRSRAADTIRRLWIVATVTLVATAFAIWAWSLMMLESSVPGGI